MEPYPVTYSLEYQDRPLNRLTTFFRFFTVLPILAVLIAIGSTSVLFLPVLLMLLFRGKYPRWWYDWNLEMQRFQNRIGAYMLLVDDRYPSTDDPQGVRLEYPPHESTAGLSRGMPLVKWLLAIPHILILAFLFIGVFFAVLGAWFAILFTGRYPRGIFNFVEGVMRWSNRVTAYAFTLVTDAYPPFRLGP
jgi:hypothetical protein